MTEIIPYYEKTFERHRRDIEAVELGEKPHLRFNEPLGMAYITILETFKHYKGVKANKNFILELWQKKAVLIWAGWERLNSDGEWVRRFDESFWFLPKKNGKTILGSGLGIADTILRGEVGGEVYAFATVKKQAELAWTGFKELLQRHDELKKYTSIAYNTITLSQKDTTFQMFGRDADTVEGVSPTFALSDERHIQKDNSVRDNIKTAMIARKQPHLMDITTAGDDIESVCYVDYEYAKKVVEGILEDDNLFVFIAEAPRKPEGQGYDDWWFREEVWRAANPNYGVSVTKDGMEKAAKKAQEKSDQLPSFLRKHLNIWRSEDDGFITKEEWDACRVAELNLLGRKIVGLDLSFRDDFSARVDVYQNGEYFDIVPRSYIPEGKIYERERELRVPLYDWINRDLITATKGVTIDQQYILDDIVDGLDITDFIGYDPTYAKWIINKIESNYNFQNSVMVRQTTWGLSLATIFFRDLVREKRVRHLGDPIMNWHISNVSLAKDNQGNIKPDRTNVRKKVDLVAAVINAFACIATGEPVKQVKSIYEERGLREL